uniref:Rho-GAP domain-containing protein n=1 Tax=Panagrolaimus sp. ES5 TaxID=591445 RepID=A0AC34FJ13_9BILA
MLKREYTTLKSTGSSVSQESHDSGASVNGAFIGAFRTSTGRSITDTESKPPASPSSHGSPRSYNNKVPGSGHMSRLSMRSNQSTTSDMSSAPLAKPEFVEINSEFYYEAPTADTPSSYNPTDVTTTPKNEKTTPTMSKQKKIEKLLPKFGRLILEGGSSSSAGPSNVIYSSNDSSQTDTPTTGVVEMFVNGTRYVQSHPPSNITTINIPTLERITRLSDNIPQIRFRVNGTDRNVDDHGNVTIDSSDPTSSPQKISSSSTTNSAAAAAVSRLTYQIRCHSSESIFLEVESPSEEPIPPESPPTPTKGFLRNRRVIRRQGSLREGGNSRRNRSQIRAPRSFLSANIAHKFVASFRQKTRIPQTSTDDGVEIVSVSRLDSFGNPTKRTGPTSTSMPQSPNMSKKSSLSKKLEGIYRVPGNQSQVAELEKQFKLNPNIDLKILNMPLHVIATAIKKFFDTLPEPIIPFTLHLPIIQCIENFPTEDRSPSSMTKSSPGSANSFSTAVESFLTDDQQRQQHIDKLSKLLKQELPTVNQHVLGFLTAHLKRVAKNSHKTSMDVRNLSKVFGPTLFRPEFNSFEMMASQMSKFELAMFLMLQNNDQIF